MATHYRVIFPVGHGGMAFESIDNCSVLYDCGSLSSPARVEMFIEMLKSHGVQHIDYLFISHFDQDHVNGLNALLNNNIFIKQAVMSYIPEMYRSVFNLVTRGAYNAIRNLILRLEGRVIEIGEERQDGIHGRSFKLPLWEWTAESMLRNDDFNKLRDAFIRQRIDVAQLTDANYLNRWKKKINEAFKTVFGAQGPNAKGLIVLSQKTQNAQLIHAELQNAICYCTPYYPQRNLSASFKNTGCLYVGDSRIKTTAEINGIKEFLRKYLVENQLLLMQLPHHGSVYNLKHDLHNQISADVYFVHDNTDSRIHRSQQLYNTLTATNKLYVVKDICSDLILGICEIQ